MKIIESKLLPKQEFRSSKSRIYFFPENETVLENFAERRTRPYKEYRKLVAEAIAMATGAAPTDLVSIKWSQKAGCSCGCSPGFVVGGWVPGLKGANLFVTVGQDA